MKHSKKILALAMSVAVVASIAAAGTLAYLTSTTGPVTNQFNVATSKGAVNITLDETNILDPDGDRIDHNEYNDLTPGSVLVKDPTVHVDANSEDSYVFVAVKNPFGVDPDGNAVAVFKNAAGEDAVSLQAAIESFGWTYKGECVDGAVYQKHGATADATTIAAGSELKVFDGLTINGALKQEYKDSTETFTSLVSGKQITIKAFAIQQANLTDAQAYEQAQTVFGGAAAQD